MGPELLHVMPPKPELLHVMPAEPELLHVMPAEPELLHVKVALPELLHVKHTHQLHPMNSQPRWPPPFQSPRTRWLPAPTPVFLEKMAASTPVSLDKMTSRRLSGPLNRRHLLYPGRLHSLQHPPTPVKSFAA
ncbi:hypothetical protein PO909_004528 [Leuciscus waleckii]